MKLHKWYWARLTIPIMAILVSFILKAPAGHILQGISLGYFWCWLYSINWIDFDAVHAKGENNDK